MKKKLTVLFSLVLMTAIILACQSASVKSEEGAVVKPSDPFVYQKEGQRGMQVQMGPHGGVASTGPLGSAAGVKVLQDGGNAIDAAITTAMMSTVTVPDANGIGGHGGMMIYLAKTKEIKFLDWGGPFPKAFNISDWGNPPALPPERSVQNTVLPGTLKGWEVALQTYGTYSLAKALAPAIEYAENGFPMYPGFGFVMDWVGDQFDVYPDVLDVFAPNGKIPAVGEYMRLPELAATYKRIAKEGTGIFYGGDLGQKIVKFMNENGSKFTIEEFRDYKPVWRDLLKTTYRGYDIYAVKNQNFTPVALEMFNFWEHFDLPNMNPMAPDTLHIIAEGMKLGWADRVYYGDPAQSTIEFDKLVSKEYMDAYYKLFNMNKVLPFEPAGDQTGFLASPKALLANHKIDTRHHISTTSIIAVDKDGNVAAITQTLGGAFGSMHVVPGTGIILNNEGEYFDLEPVNGNNYPAPGRLEENQMGAIFALKDGKFIAGTAMPGGWGIPVVEAQVLERVLDYGMYMQQAIEFPRITNSYEPLGGIIVEPGINAATRAALEAKGHKIAVDVSDSFGILGVVINPATGAREVAADPGALTNYSRIY
jgi:gamma-glutamyltranspeptidase/glutathione hydrolase